MRKNISVLVIIIFAFLFYGCTSVQKTSQATSDAVWDFTTETVPDKAKGLGRFSVKAVQPKSWVETLRVLWGSSTRALEEARVEAVSQTYPCPFNECFDAVLGLGRDFRTPQPLNVQQMFSMGGNEEPAEAATPSDDQSSEIPVVSDDSYCVFIKDRTRKHIVVMDIPGVINTTEVGIFFSNPDEKTTQVEIASLSPLAKERAAEIIFHQLETLFPTPQENASLP